MILFHSLHLSTLNPPQPLSYFWPVIGGLGVLGGSFLGYQHSGMGTGTPEGTENSPKEVATVGLGGLSGFKEESHGCVKMALKKIQ